MRGILACAVVGLAIAAAGCDRTSEETSLKAEEPAPTAKVTERKAPATKSSFVLVDGETPLHEAPNDDSPSFSAKDRGDGDVVVLAVDPDAEVTDGWIGLKASTKQSVCGYQAVAVDKTVFARRDGLMRTLRAEKVIEGPDKKTRLALKPGVAVRPTETEGTYVVMTDQVRAKVVFEPGELSREVPAATFEAPPAADTLTPEQARQQALKEAAEFGMIGLYDEAERSPLRVGALAVHLSKKHPPALLDVEGDDSLARVETPCAVVVGKRPAGLREAHEFGMIGLLNSGAGGDPDAPTVPWGPDEDLDADVLGGLAGNKWVEPDLSNGLGLPEGGRGTGEGIGLGSVGTIGHGAGTGHGYGSGSGGLRSGPAPRIRMGVFEVQGKLPIPVVQRIVRTRFGTFRQCYQEGLKREPGLSGRVLLSFVVTEEGLASGVKSVPKSPSEPSGTDLGDGAVVQCLLGTVSGLTFPRPESGTVSVRAPFTFSVAP